jgi:hypothetical protein
MSLRSTSTAGPMKTTKVFEGPDLGVLLDEARAEFGEAATVVAANRCRSGGFAGFFATESFEVIVEVPVAPPVGNDICDICDPGARCAHRGGRSGRT